MTGTVNRPDPPGSRRAVAGGDVVAASILVVDDDADNIALVGRYLERQGFAVRTARCGEDGLAAVAARAPDLVLLDVMMPGIGGLEVCRRLKADAETSAIPVVLVTALDGREDRIEGLQAGADEFLSKPVHREELLVRVQSLLRLRAVRDALEARRIAALAETFGRYVSPRLVQSFLARPETAEAALADRSSRVGAAVMFADLRNFTRISEQLSPDHVVSLLNEYFACLTAAVHHHEGTMFSMAGDNLLVGFGVPFEQPETARTAARCALAMQREFARASADWPRRFGVAGAMGIGASYGEVVVGNVGSPGYMSYTIIGDAVNVAARLVSQAAEHQILVSERLRLRVDDDVDGVAFERLAPMRLKGKTVPQTVYSLRMAGPAGPGNRAPGRVR